MYKKLIEKVKTIVYEAADIIDDIKKPDFKAACLQQNEHR